MNRLMFDSANARTIPRGAALVAGYVDGPLSQWSPADWQRFPGSTIVPIAVFATTNDGVVLDVERGNATPAEVPAWLDMRRRAGIDPTVYCALDDIPNVRSACRDTRTVEPYYWAARPDGDPTIPDGCVAVQYAWLSPFDISAVRDYWPGVDRLPLITEPELGYGAARLLYPATAGPNSNGVRYDVAARAEGGERVYTLRLRP